jgi:hypothetical protein
MTTLDMRGQSNLPFVDRFWKRVRIGRDEDCWPWTGKISHGYGQALTRTWTDEQGKAHQSYCQAHRLAYFLVLGDIPEGLEPDHDCNVKLCCNPGHLELVSHKDNIERGWFYRITDKLMASYPQIENLLPGWLTPPNSNRHRSRPITGWIHDGPDL